LSFATTPKQNPVEDSDMAARLDGKKVAILVANGFEQIELTAPKEALEREGAKTYIVSPEPNRVRGWQHTNWGDEFPVDMSVDSANPSDYDALLLPGGVMNPDKMRMIPSCVQFVKAFFDQGKPVAAICHGPWILINAGVVARRTVTSWPSLQADLRNAGANWVDQEVVKDANLITSRKPDDIPAFNQAIIEAFSMAGMRELITA